MKSRKVYTNKKYLFLEIFQASVFSLKTKLKTKTRIEMIVLITPHILMVPGEAGKVTDEILEGTEHPLIKQKRKYMLEYDSENKGLN